MKQKMKQWVAYILSFCMIFSMTQMVSGSAVYAAEVADGEIDESQEGVQTVRYLTGTETTSTDSQAYLESHSDRLTDFIAGTESMTWSVQFKTSNATKLQALLFLENSGNYCAFYLNGGSLKFEPQKNNIAVSASVSYADNQYHTAELEIKKGEAVILRMDGTEVARNTSPTMLKDLSWTPTAFTIGGAKDYSPASGWKFTGSMKNVVLTKNVLAKANSIWSGSNLKDEAISVEQGANLSEGSLSLSYRLKKESNVKKTLMTFGNGGEIYADPASDKIGVSIGGTKVEKDAGTALGTTKWHNVTLVKSGSQLELYVDGSLAGNETYSGSLDFSTIQKGADIYCSGAEIYNTALSAEQIEAFHDNTNLTTYPDPTEKLEGYYKGPNRDIFNAGFDGSVSYRIPAITTSKKTGTVIAAIDKRWYTSADTGVNDTVIRRSEDNGKTWGPVIPVIDMPDDDAYTIDPEIVVDNDPDSPHYGRIYILVDLNSYGTSLWGAVDGIGYQKIDGKDYQILQDRSGNSYTIREEGIVYDSEGNVTEYRVETEAEAPYREQGALYKNGVKIGSIYKNAELAMINTIYMMMTYSDDDGKTWSRPRDISPEIKASWMSFFGVGPGAGIQLQHGEHKGRLMFSMYCIKHGENARNFSSYNVYTDDYGETWHRGGSPNDNQAGGPEFSTRELNENCLVELNNGHLIQFMKNATSEVAAAVSTDGGATWSEVRHEKGIREVYCEMAVLHYGNLVDPADGQTKEAIIFANPSGSGRDHGKVRIAFVNDDDTLDWAYDKLIEEHRFLYNSMTLMNDGNIGMIYENEKGSSTSAAFTSFSAQYIMDPNVYENTPQPSEMSVDILDASGNETETLKIGSELRVNITFDNYVFASGNVTSNIQIGDEIKEAQLIGNADKNTLVFSYTVKPEDTGDIEALAEVNIKEGGVAETIYNVPLTDKPFVTKTVSLGRAQAEGFAQLPTTRMTATVGSYQSGSDGNKALDNDPSTIWHSNWSETEAAGYLSKHWIEIDLGGTYLVSGLKYLPRSGGGNGTLAKYQIEVSMDGETFYPYTRGKWASNGNEKSASFEYGPVPATHVRLRSLGGATHGDASAAEIRIIGSSQTEGAANRAALVQDLVKYGEYAEQLKDIYPALAEALTTAESVALDTSATQAQIDEALQTLTAAITSALQSLDTDLAAALAAADEKEEGAYTVSSWSAYQAAVEAARELADDASQEEKLEAYLALKDAEANLKEAANPRILVKNITVTAAGGKTTLQRGDGGDEPLQLSADVMPENATNRAVVWRSSDTKMATVDQTGLVTAAKKTGVVTITAEAVDGSRTKGTYELTITGEDEPDMITAPAISYTKPAADECPLPASVSAGGENSAHHDEIHDWARVNPVDLVSMSASTEPVKYVDGVWAINDQMKAQESGDDDKFNVIGGTSAVFKFKLYMKSFANNISLVSKGDMQYCIKVINVSSNEGISAFAGEWNEGQYLYKAAGETSYVPSLNQWADVIGVIDTAGKTRIYVNGKAGGTSRASGIAKTKSRFAIGGQNNNDSGDNAAAWDRVFTSNMGYLADVEFYKDASAANITLDTLDETYDTDAKKWAYLSNLLESADPTANYTGMPYDAKTVWSIEEGDVLAPGTAFADDTAYTATTTFTAHEGFVFPTETAAKAAFENEVKAAVRAGDAAPEAGSVTVTVESESVMKVEYRCRISSEVTPEPYTVTFHKNDGTNVTATATVEKNGTIPADQEPEWATDTATHTFGGWYTDEACTEKYEITTPVTSNLPLYAKWTIKEYTVTFNSNGGTEVAPVTVNAGSKVGEPAAPTKGDETFVGWYTDEELTQRYDFDTPVNADITLYAKWRPAGTTVNQYTVTFHKNDGTDGTATATVDENEAILASQVPDWATDTATHTFDGWYTDEECTEEYSMTTPVTSDLDLHAKWTKKGGEGDAASEADATAKANEALTQLNAIIQAGGGSVSAGTQLPVEIDGVTLKWTPDSEHVTVDAAGYIAVADGLKETKDVEFTVEVSYGGDQKVTKPVTVKVSPSQSAEEHTVTFHKNDGTNETATVKVEKNGKIQASQVPEWAKDTATHTFDGWYTDAACTKEYDMTKAVTADLPLYAKWTEKGGEGNAATKEDATTKADAAIEQMNTIIQTGGGSVSAGDKLPAEIEGVTLKWTTNSEHVTVDAQGNIIVADGLQETKDVEFTVEIFYGEGQSVTKNKTVTVRPAQSVIPPVKCTVTFDSTGGTKIEAVTVDAGQAVDRPAARPTKTGYTFANWCSDKNCANVYNFAEKVTGDITLYAKWTANTYRITFNANGTGVNGMPSAMTKKYNETLNLSLVKKPTRNDYKFLGWSRTASGSVINNSLKIEANITLYAKWEALPNLTRGMTETVEKIKYKVLDVNKKTVAVIGSENKKMTSINIPDTVPIKGVTCTVVQIDPKAFKGYGKLKTVTIGKNVTTIGKNAFLGCKKLGAITLKGKALKSVKSGAFKNTSKKLKVKVPKMKSSQKKNLLKTLKKGGNKKITIK